MQAESSQINENGWGGGINAKTNKEDEISDFSKVCIFNKPTLNSQEELKSCHGRWMAGGLRAPEWGTNRSSKRQRIWVNPIVSCYDLIY